VRSVERTWAFYRFLGHGPIVLHFSLEPGYANFSDRQAKIEVAQYLGCGPNLASKIEGKPCRDFLKGATSKIEQRNQNLTVGRNFFV
jgi:hypothetical protein